MDKSTNLPLKNRLKISLISFLIIRDSFRFTISVVLQVQFSSLDEFTFVMNSANTQYQNVFDNYLFKYLFLDTWICSQ